MKTACAAIAFLLITNFANAQGHPPDFGLKAGLNVANVKIANNDGWDPRTSFHVGGLAHIHLSRYIGIQPEIMYSGQGAKTDNATLNLGYVNVPVLLQYMAGTGFRLQTGPQLGALVTAKTKVGDVTTDRKDDYRKIDFSWAFGASYVTNSGFGIDARYNLGLNNINEATNPKIQNRVFQVGLFYQFRVTPVGVH